MARNGGSRAREGPGSVGFGSPGGSSDDITPAKGTTVVSTVQRGSDLPWVCDPALRPAAARCTPNPCWDGHPLAAAEHARQMRIGAVRLGRLLGEPAPIRHHGEWCAGEFGPDGRWREHCKTAAA